MTSISSRTLREGILARRWGPQGRVAVGRVVKTGALWTIGGIAIAMFAWHALALAPGPGLDESWRAGLSMAAHTGIPFGNQALFTYGPLGFLDFSEIWYGSTGQLAFGYALLMRVGMGVVAFRAARRNYGLVAGWLVALLVASVDTEAIEPVIAFIVAVEVLQEVKSGRRALVLCCAISAFAGFELLTKESTGITILVTAALLAIALPGRRRVNVSLAFVSFAAALVISWLIAGQSLPDLPAFVRGAASITAGYAAAMQYEAAGLEPEYAAVVIVFGLGLWSALSVTESLTRRARWGVVALWTGFCFLYFKEGFVRHDIGHGAICFEAMLAGLLAFRWNRRRYQGLLAISAALVIALGSLKHDLGADFSPRHNLDVAITQLRQVSSARTRARLTANGRLAIEAAEPLDSTALADLRGQTVAIWPNELALAWAYRLHWDPLPVLQSYSAYTSYLDRKDAAALTSAHAPQRILYPYDPGIDGRVPAFDVPATSVTILCRYHPIYSTSTSAILALRTNRCSAPMPLGVVHADWGQTVAVPAPPNDHSLVLVRIAGAGTAGLEHVRELLYKPKLREVMLDGASHRLVTDVADDGLPLRASAGFDFPAPFSIATGSSTIAVDKDGQAPTGGRPLTFSFFVRSFASQ